MKKLISILLSIAVLFSVSAVAVSAGSVCEEQPQFSGVELNKGLVKSAVAKLAADEDMADGELPDIWDMSRDEFVAFFTPENATENLCVFVELFFGGLYDEMICLEPIVDDEFNEECILNFETADEYLQYMIDEIQKGIEKIEKIDEAFVKLTDDELQMLADKLNEVIAYYQSIYDDVETPSDIETSSDIDDPSMYFDVTVDSLKTLHTVFEAELLAFQQEIELFKGFIESDTFEEDIKTLVLISAYLNDAQSECKKSYYDDVYERFYSEYPDGSIGKTVSFEELEYYNVVDYVDYFLESIGEGSFTLYLYADKDNLTPKQVDDLKAVQSLFATLSSDVTGTLSDYIGDFESDLVNYVGPALKYGDATGDGVINMLDVLLIRKYIAKQPVSVNADVADVNCDDAVNMLDVLLIRKYIAKQPVTLGPKG